MGTRNNNSSISSGSVKMIINILILILGIIFISNPSAALQGVTITLGILLIVYGGIMIGLHEIKRSKGEPTPALGWPILWMIVGILLLVFVRQASAWLLPLVVGVWILILGFMNLHTSHQIRSMGGKTATIALILAIAEIILGIISLVSMAFQGTALGIMIGICMLIYGIASIVSWAINYLAMRNA